MEEYHKILTVWKRGNDKKVIVNEWNIPEFYYLKDNNWIWTEKVDGTNIRINWNYISYEVNFGGKTDRAQIPTMLINRLNQLFPVDKWDQKNLTSMCLYGEGYGGNIQEGRKYRPDGSVDFVLFDVRINGLWLERHNVEDVANELGIKVVPIVGTGNLMEAINLTEKGMNSLVAPSGLMEGLVLRPDMELQTRLGQRIIAKIKHKDFKEE